MARNDQYQQTGVPGLEPWPFLVIATSTNGLPISHPQQFGSLAQLPHRTDVRAAPKLYVGTALRVGDGAGKESCWEGNDRDGKERSRSAMMGLG